MKVSFVKKKVNITQFFFNLEVSNQGDQDQQEVHRLVSLIQLVSKSCVLGQIILFKSVLSHAMLPRSDWLLRSQVKL